MDLAKLIHSMFMYMDLLLSWYKTEACQFVWDWLYIQEHV